MPQIACWIDTCSEGQVKWGMCPRHHQLWITHFPPKRTRLFNRSDEERFRFYVRQGASEVVQREFGARADCWPWGAALTPDGYGAFAPSRELAHGQQTSHATSLVLAGVDIADGMSTDHRCRFRPCANPEHLDRVTSKVNTLRGAGLSAKNARKVECARGHQFTEANTSIAPDGSRVCRACSADETRRYRGANPDKFAPRTGVKGKGQYQKERTHCKEGHPLSGENLLLEDRKHSDGSTRQARRCRECRLRKARDAHARRKGGVDLRRSDETCRNGHVRTEENTRWHEGKRRCQDCRNEWRERRAG